MLHLNRFKTCPRNLSITEINFDVINAIFNKIYISSSGPFHKLRLKSFLSYSLCHDLLQNVIQCIYLIFISEREHLYTFSSNCSGYKHKILIISVSFPLPNVKFTFNLTFRKQSSSYTWGKKGLLVSVNSYTV